MDQTPLLKLPYIMSAQAQKHVTHNEAIRTLDALVLLTVSSRSMAEAPTAPSEGERHIVASSAGGSFAGHDGEVAIFQDGAWTFHSPHEGWLAWCVDEDQLLAFSASQWVETGARAGGDQNLPMVGVNTTADQTNRLAVASEAALFNHAGNGHQLKINKATQADTASLLFQTNWSGRAEMGLAGTDNFAIKVSADGHNWHAALSVDGATGALTVPHLSTSGSGSDSGLSFGNLTSASSEQPHGNKTLSVDGTGHAILAASSMPRYVMTGTDTDTTIIRDFDAQVQKGTGIYHGNTSGSIANAPVGDWANLSLVGVEAGFFFQLAIMTKNCFFRSGRVDDVGGSSWYTLTRQSGLTDGRVPRYYLVDNGNDQGLTDGAMYDDGSGNVGIGAPPDASALLDVSSTSQGFLPPRMTEAERDAIVSPVEGLIVYNLTAKQPQFFNGASWAGMTVS